MRRFSDHLTYANVVSTLCLFALLGGGAYAAVKLKKDSVGSKQVKNGSLKGVDIKAEALTGADIAEGTLGKVPLADQADTAASADAATTADSAASAETAASADTAGDADTLDGVDSTDLVRSFGANIDDTAPTSLFTVAQLDAELLGDTSPASASCFRVRNTGTGTITVSDLIDQTTGLFQVPANTTSSDRCTNGPLVLTNDDHPEQMLLFGCAETGRAYCFGQLIAAPTK